MEGDFTGREPAPALKGKEVPFKDSAPPLLKGKSCHYYFPIILCRRESESNIFQRCVAANKHS